MLNLFATKTLTEGQFREEANSGNFYKATYFKVKVENETIRCIIMSNADRYLMGYWKASSQLPKFFELGAFMAHSFELQAEEQGNKIYQIFDHSICYDEWIYHHLGGYCDVKLENGQAYHC